MTAPNYRVHLPGGSITALAKKPMKTSHQLVPPGPRRTSPAGDANVRPIWQLAPSLLVGFILLFSSLVLACAQDRVPPQTSKFRSQVLWARIEYHVNGRRPTKLIARIQGERQLAAIVAAVEALKLGPPTPRDLGFPPPNLVVFGTAAGLVKAGWGDGTFVIYEGPLKGESPAPKALDDLLQVYRADASPDTLSWYLGPGATGVSVQ